MNKFIFCGFYILLLYYNERRDEVKEVVIMKKSIGIHMPVYPAPVLIIGNYDEKGKPNVMAAAWGGICCSVPPCITISLQKIRYSYNNIVDRKAFTVNIPSEKYVKESDYFGMVSGREHDKLSITNLTPMRGEKVDAPYIEEFPVSIECKLLQTIELGTHVMLVGKVVNTLADEECLTCDNYPDPEKVRPIIFTPKYRRYYALGADLGEAFHMGRFFMK
jgi:flavin reductase (DIM6/NTAB) family NADH-FMN oxidoreductase RutF